MVDLLESLLVLLGLVFVVWLVIALTVSPWKLWLLWLDIRSIFVRTTYPPQDARTETLKDDGERTDG